MLAGCGGGPDVKPIAPDEQGLRELAAEYRDFFRKNKRGPKGLNEIQGTDKGRGRGKGKRQGQGQDSPNAIQMIKSGELVVQWGAPLSPAGDAVLAYLKSVPDQGGSVLMADGDTIKTMTADEFKAAPKASGR
jgi:hypothetical protein